MSSIDHKIWDIFRRNLPPGILGLYFDVGLGEGRDAGADASDEHRQWWRRWTEKRADVVMSLPASWVLIEVRDRAQANAVGRLLMYLQLWMADPPDERPLALWLVTNYEDPDVKRLCDRLSIEYYVVEWFGGG